MLLNSRDSVHDRNVLTLELIDDDVADFDRCKFVEEQDVASLHRRLHAARKYHDYRAFSPKRKLQTVPDHHCRGHDQSERESLGK